MILFTLLLTSLTTADHALFDSVPVAQVNPHNNCNEQSQTPGNSCTQKSSSSVPSYFPQNMILQTHSMVNTNRDLNSNYNQQPLTVGKPHTTENFFTKYMCRERKILVDWQALLAPCKVGNYFLSLDEVVGDLRSRVRTYVRTFVRPSPFFLETVHYFFLKLYTYLGLVSVRKMLHNSLKWPKSFLSNQSMFF